MFKNRSIEFFEGENNRLSMTRLLCYISIFPASYVVVMTKTEATLGWYLGAYVLGYVGGKTADVFGKKPQQEITETTTRTVSKGTIETEIPAKDISIKAEGDVNIDKKRKKK